MYNVLEHSGNMAPEYAMHGQFSVKSDVFSFGVLVLEIISGQKNSGIRRGENIEDLLSLLYESSSGATRSAEESVNEASITELYPR
ncbi:hypothetical protein VNO77_12354 [Canavalia gladiata]|uniref:Serine-threonine/tyrosine-protein kinase catalytic domain-containing protein n=1 Tax=Canavalia gladiata TaxID=3824 RepID=A0AAN9LWS5_CANGL